MHICSKEFSCRGGGQEDKVNFKKAETTKRRQSAAKTNDNRWIGQRKKKKSQKENVQKWFHSDLEYFKTSNVQDTNEGGTLAFGSV